MNTGGRPHGVDERAALGVIGAARRMWMVLVGRLVRAVLIFDFLTVVLPAFAALDTTTGWKIGLVSGGGASFFLARFLRRQYDLSLASILEQDLVLADSMQVVLRDFGAILSLVRSRDFEAALRAVDDLQKLLLQIIADETEFGTISKPKTISSNVMVPMTTVEGEQFLRLIHFSHMRIGREPTDLALDEANPSPGAATAYCTHEPYYVADTTVYPATVFDPDKPYRTIWSLPLLSDGVRAVVGVVNIDTPVVDAFSEANRDQLKKVLAPWLQAVTASIRLYGLILRLQELGS